MLAIFLSVIWDYSEFTSKKSRHSVLSILLSECLGSLQNLPVNKADTQ